MFTPAIGPVLVNMTWITSGEPSAFVFARSRAICAARFNFKKPSNCRSAKSS